MSDPAALSPQDEKALSLLSGRSEAMLAKTLEWANINTGSDNAHGLERLAPILCAAFGELGASIERVVPEPPVFIDNQGLERPEPTGPVILVTQRPDAPIQVVLTGHYDTVFSPGTFEVFQDFGDGRYGGPGMADMKGGLCVMLEALKTFEAVGNRDALGYRIVLTPDEECGNFASSPYLERAAFGADVGLTYEPAFEWGGMSGARKGSAVFDLVLKGRAAHAGRNPEEGRSAMFAACDLVTQIEKLNANVDAVTFNVGKIDGGSPVNIVADLAVVRLGVRAPDGDSARWADHEIRQAFGRVLCRDGICGQVHGGFYRPPKPKNAAQRDLMSAAEMTARPLGLSVEWIDTGGVCEGNNVFAAGVPNLDTLGVRGGRIHSPDEFVVINSFSERAALSALLLNRLADGRIDAKAIKAKMSQA